MCEVVSSALMKMKGGRDVSGRGVVRHESLSDKVIFEQRRQGCDWVSSEYSAWETVSAKGLRQEHALVWRVVQSDLRAVNAGRLTRDE